MVRRWSLVLLLTLLLFGGSALIVQAEEVLPVGDLRAMAASASEYVETLTAATPDKFVQIFGELHRQWEIIEDPIADAYPHGYLELEQKFAALKQATTTAKPDRAIVASALAGLAAEAVEVAAHLESNGASVGTEAVTTEELMRDVALLRSAVAARSLDEVRPALERVVSGWPGVEGAVAAKSGTAYAAIEASLAGALHAIQAEPTDWAALESMSAELSAQLEPFARPQTYTLFDAAIIILREGLEALLIVAALLAFLTRTGNSDKRSWIWLGTLAGLLVSVAVALALQVVFSRVAAGRNREVIEGMTGLVAAAMLFYVSYWLHGKSSLQGWRRFINENTTRALARGNLIGLSLLAFFAVLREGAETTIFYLGIAPSIAFRDLALGVAAGLVVLALIGVLMLKLGVRLPLNRFFLVASVLVYYLGFKFLGVGVHALQVAGVLPSSPISFVNAIPLLGVFPTWETVLPQSILLVVALAVFVHFKTAARAQNRDQASS